MVEGNIVSTMNDVILDLQGELDDTKAKLNAAKAEIEKLRSLIIEDRDSIIRLWENNIERRRQ